MMFENHWIQVKEEKLYDESRLDACLSPGTRKHGNERFGPQLESGAQPEFFTGMGGGGGENCVGPEVHYNLFLILNTTL
jgi:hypothetical protein